MSELLQCPFCGGDKIDMSVDEDSMVFAYCLKCHCCLRGNEVEMSEESEQDQNGLCAKDREDMAEIWNTRPPSPKEATPCPECKGEGRILFVYERGPNSPPGNGYGLCPTCQPAPSSVTRPNFKNFNGDVVGYIEALESYATHLEQSNSGEAVKALVEWLPSLFDVCKDLASGMGEVAPESKAGTFMHHLYYCERLFEEALAKLRSQGDV